MMFAAKLSNKEFGSNMFHSFATGFFVVLSTHAKKKEGQEEVNSRSLRFTTNTVLLDYSYCSTGSTWKPNLNNTFCGL